MIQPGLERIGLLLKNVELPWKAIHVAGTNGKGSVCHYASALLTRRTVRTGCFTSPHLLHRWDCISINREPVQEALFKRVEEKVLERNQKENINASEFEILTATAFQIFNEKKVEVGVVEVGMGGKLDATNILNNQVATVISKIARDHEAFLGNTLDSIARHKAGILRPHVPYMVNPMNEWSVHDVIDEVAKEVGAGPRVHGETEDFKTNLYPQANWRKFAEHLLPFQRDNAVLAILAVIEGLKAIGKFGSQRHTPAVSIRKILPGIKNFQNPGRLQFTRVRQVFGAAHRGVGRQIFVDGAHNEDAATVLSQYVEKKVRYSDHRRKSMNAHPLRNHTNYPVTWVIAMSEGKDAHRFLAKLLEPNDNVVVTSFGPVDGMPWAKPMDPQKLLQIVQEVRPGISSLYVPTTGAMRALCTAKYLSDDQNAIVLTGSLYLVGELFLEKEIYEPSDIEAADKEERTRVYNYINEKLTDGAKSIETDVTLERADREKQKLEEEIEELDREIQRLAEEERRVKEDSAREMASLVLPSETKRSPTLSTPVKGFTGLQSDIEDMRRRLGTSSASAPLATDLGLQYYKLRALDPERYAKEHGQNYTKPEVRIRKHFVHLTPEEEEELPGRRDGKHIPLPSPHPSGYTVPKDAETLARDRVESRIDRGSVDDSSPREMTVRRVESKTKDQSPGSDTPEDRVESKEEVDTADEDRSFKIRPFFAGTDPNEKLSPDRKRGKQLSYRVKFETTREKRERLEALKRAEKSAQ